MEKFTTIQTADLPADTMATLRHQLTGEIAGFSVSLILKNRVVGSGTFVNVASRSGILTAHHVAELFWKDRDDIGLNIADYAHRFAIHTEHQLATVKSKMSFFSVGRRSFAETVDPPLDDATFYLAGSPAVMSEETNLGREKVLTAHHLIAEADFQDLSQRDGFDYIRLRLICGESGFPNDYGGVSGGGIWVTGLTMDRAKGLSSLEFSRPFLCGVAFHQSDLAGSERIITGHGPVSLERRLKDYLAHQGR
jgi:hypothetical protein